MPPQDLLFYSGINQAPEHAGIVYQTANPDLELPGDRYEKFRAYIFQPKDMEGAMYAFQQDPDNMAAKVQLSREMQKKNRRNCVGRNEFENDLESQLNCVVRNEFKNHLEKFKSNKISRRSRQGKLRK